MSWRARSYTVIRSGPRVNVHEEEAIAEGFDSVAEAQAYIREHDLQRVQIVAECRRWLTGDEYQQLDKAIVEAKAA